LKWVSILPIGAVQALLAKIPAGHLDIKVDFESKAVVTNVY
jgi:hypothetical protein